MNQPKPNYYISLVNSNQVAVYTASFSGASIGECFNAYNEYLDKLIYAGITKPTMTHAKIYGDKCNLDSGHAYLRTINDFDGVYTVSIYWITEAIDCNYSYPDGAMDLYRVERIKDTMDSLNIDSQSRMLCLNSDQMKQLDGLCTTVVPDKSDAMLSGFRLVII